MSKLLSASESLALIDRLKSIVQEFATQHGELEKEFKTRRSAEMRSSDAAAKDLAQRHQERTTSAETKAQEELARWLAAAICSRSS